MVEPNELNRLARLIRRIESGVGAGAGSRPVEVKPPLVSTGWGPVDAALARAWSSKASRHGQRRRCPWHPTRNVNADKASVEASGGLVCGAVHEWFGGVSGNDRGQGRPVRAVADRWCPPLCIFAHLAKRVRDRDAAAHCGWVIWIGQACWPYPWMLVGGDQADGGLLRGSIFVDPPDAASRLWAIDLAVRCSAVAAVIADGRRLNMAATRRLQLAGQTSQTLMLLARSVDELGELSAAATRWLVQPVPAPSQHPKWQVQLLRCKGVQPSAGMDASNFWHLEWDHAKGAVIVSADVVDRPGAQAAATPATGPDPRPAPRQTA